MAITIGALIYGVLAIITILSGHAPSSGLPPFSYRSTDNENLNVWGSPMVRYP